MTNSEFKGELEQRSKRFAVELVNWLATLPSSRVVGAIIYQLAKSGPSIGANYREANKAESHPDFTHKIGIVEKEASETVYWFEVLLESNLIAREQKTTGSTLHAEAVELLKLFSSISRSSRSHSRTHELTH